MTAPKRTAKIPARAKKTPPATTPPPAPEARYVYPDPAPESPKRLAYLLSAWMREVVRVLPTNYPSLDRALFNATTGLSEEIGEVHGILKKHHSFGQPLDHAHLREELGDSWYYLFVEMILHNVSFGDVLSHAIVKLRARFPTDGNPHDAMAKADRLLTAEDFDTLRRAVLEKAAQEEALATAEALPAFVPRAPTFRSLAELRELSRLTQEQVAHSIDSPLSLVQMFERQKDALVGSLVRYIRGCGGSVEILVTLSDGSRHRLKTAEI